MQKCYTSNIPTATNQEIIVKKFSKPISFRYKTRFTSISKTGNGNILKEEDSEIVHMKDFLENTMNTINTFSLYWIPLL